MAGFAQRVTTEANARIRRQIDFTPAKGKAAEPYKAVSIELKNPSKINEVASMADVIKIHPVQVLALDGISTSSDRPEGGKQHFVSESWRNSDSATGFARDEYNGGRIPPSRP